MCHRIHLMNRLCLVAPDPQLFHAESPKDRNRFTKQALGFTLKYLVGSQSIYDEGPIKGSVIHDEMAIHTYKYYKRTSYKAPR